ncbi:O-antigen ligase family protein [Selenomonas caprae]|uniref:O-antigen ligase family protein n=1 Tax=Selenomonas caprae TaxID=2606905 RepID=A0A5D6WG56_9FIRM|nr:O-antigen ligase family protein [Selenomonas caprae]TYZ26890.1 O-antigen ligase family protein [Selenomonas caprae]
MENKYYQYMYYIMVLFALASNIAPAATSVAIVLGSILVVYHRVTLKKWPEFDAGFLKAFGIYFLVWFVIALNSLDVVVSIKDVFATFYRIFPLFFVMTCIREKKQLKNILIAFAVSVIITDIAATWQVLHHITRPQGLSSVATVFGTNMLMAIAVMGAAAADNSFSKRCRAFFLATMFYAFFILIATQTRGAWIGFAFMACLVVLLYPMNRKRVLGGLAGLLVVIALIFGMSSSMQARVNTIMDLKYQSNSERLLMWQSSWEIIKDYPVWGIGPDEFKLVYNTRYISPLAKERPIPGDPDTGHGHPHNNFLKRLTEGGIVGGMAFLLLNIYIFVRLVRRYRESVNKKTINWFAFAGIILFAGVHVSGLTDANFISVPMMRELWFLIGLAMIADNVGCND